MEGEGVEKERSGWKKSKNSLAGGGTSITNSRVGTKFFLKMAFLTFWIKLTQKGFRSKTNENYHHVLNIQVNLDPKFQF